MFIACIDDDVEEGTVDLQTERLRACLLFSGQRWRGSENDGGDQETVRGLNEQGGALPASQGSGQIPTAPHEEGGGNMHGAEIGKRVKNKKVIIRSGI